MNQEVSAEGLTSLEKVSEVRKDLSSKHGHLELMPKSMAVDHMFCRSNPKQKGSKMAMATAESEREHLSRHVVFSYYTTA